VTSAVAAGVIPHSRPFLGTEEVEAVSRVIESRHIAQGSEVENLEKEWAAATGTHAAVCVGSGLAGLRLALHSVGVNAGREVIVPAYSCIAVLNAVLALGANPVLADIERDRWTLDAASAAQQRTSRSAAIIAVHLFGMPAAIDALRDLGLPIIEDCAHGIGGRIDGRPFGSAGVASVGSFYATKFIAGGEGGAVASNDEALLARIRAARNPSDQAPNGLHLNDKMTDIEAAIVRVQVGRLGWMRKERERRARRYSELLADVAKRGLLVLPDDIDGRVWYRYAVRLTSHLAMDIAQKMQSAGVFADTPVWDLRPVVTWSKQLRESNHAFDRILSLPLYPDLSDDDQDRVADTLRRFL